MGKRRFVLHWVYWHLPLRSGFPRTPPSHLREFIGNYIHRLPSKGKTIL